MGMKNLIFVLIGSILLLTSCSKDTGLGTEPSAVSQDVVSTEVAKEESSPRDDLKSVAEIAKNPETALATETAVAYIKETPEWTSRMGKDIAITDITTLPCEGCYVVYSTYILDKPGVGEDLAEMQITMDGYTVVDSYLVIGRTDYLTIAQCEEQGGAVMSVCGNQSLGMIRGEDNSCCISS